MCGALRPKNTATYFSSSAQTIKYLLKPRLLILEFDHNFQHLYKAVEQLLLQ